ncbi:squamosa promoter-binding-like protein 6 [Rutidosis leptorrhynchoides]|uniref:squamosa promoter-binding-like protein 6 n=1 Tax=Rutidosis leptorrhynchoides TaxID=125765 RepID=UPI003A9A6064
MESWKFDSISAADEIDRSNMGPMNYENNMIFVSQNAMNSENQRFDEMCFPQVIGSSLFNPIVGATNNTYSQDHEPSSKLSDSVVDSTDCRESGLFDLKLNRNVGQENPQIFGSSKITNNLNSSKVSIKNTRNACFGSQLPFCQVHGCNKSLASCKEYHKRHKVCELHSKTAKVIVKGVVQRFCQQCSRFHLLSEFDDGKRSCRKRLADHNERRRKPHGCKFKGSTRAKATSSSNWHIKLDDEMANELRSMSSITDAQLHSCQQYPSHHGSNSFSYPNFNKYQTSGTNNFITMDPTPARSLLSSQSQGASSCQSSRNPAMIPLSHNVKNNMNLMVGCESMNPSTRVWSGNGSTIDLLQLSSELERVEHQKEVVRSKCTEWCSC